MKKKRWQKPGVLDVVVRRAASRVAGLRAAHGFTLAETARRAGVTQQALSNIERGEAVPRLDTLSGLARALKVDVASLVVR